MCKLQKTQKDYYDRVYILTFKNSQVGAEDKTIELDSMPSDEFIKLFMEEQSYEKVTIKEAKSTVRTYTLE
ncbi:hypothetical protein [Bacillus cereus]|uniref:hypothetical protein n=1 Tax=Bacillus cereus TaxID=1396 RepID=UPI00240E1DBB|nr:hypothetical protein [Bacillus cereus]MDG1596089.1 hypothetical protein [Bacillus cereus]HDX9541050.1 hypothetical protein [Bacillus thuringiensis]HEF5239120.1 hypothetical protein [Bacillus cereus]